MTTLIFFGTIIAILVVLLRIAIKVILHESIVSSLRLLVAIIFSYSLLWSFFFLISGYKTIQMGSDICFDDWCATVTKIEKPATLVYNNQLLSPKGQFIILHIRVSNHARGIAQKPHKPRIHIIDDKRNYWSFSAEGQEFFEKMRGKQTPIDEGLDLNQSLETQLVFDIPKKAANPKALIEEGPFITTLIFNEDKEVFSLH